MNICKYTPTKYLDNRDINDRLRFLFKNVCYLLANGGGGSGTVNSGTQYRIGYYATTGTAISEAAAITANRALISDANGVPTHSTVTATQLSYVDATSSIQTQLNAKGVGDVTKVGTPVNNQIGVWTGDGTIEGTTALTFDSATGYTTTPNLLLNTTVDGGTLIEAAAIIYRTLNVPNNGHGFKDYSTVTNNSTSYAAHDSQVTVASTGASDHVAAFQARNIINKGTGLLNTSYGLVDNTVVASPITSLTTIDSEPYLNAGAAVSTRIALRVREYVGSSSLASNTYGIFFDGLTKATGDNYAIYDNSSSNKSYLQNLITGSSATSVASSALTVNSTTKGFLPPRMTQTQRDAIGSPATGLQIYQTDNTPGIYYYNGSSWATPSGGGGGMAIGDPITSGTEGSILFAGTSGVLQQDNANFFYDATNKRIGNGTATPATRSHIYESTTAAASERVENASFKLDFGVDSVSNWIQSRDSAGTAANLIFYHGATARITMGTAITLAGTLALGANSITMTGSIAATGARVLKGWFTDVESTNIPTVGGTSLSTVSQAFQNKTLTNSNNVLGGVTMTLGSDADGDIYYRSSNVLTRLPKGTALQQLRMNAGATAPEWTTISSGGGMTWTEVTGTSQSAAVNNGYIANNAGLVTVTIPTTAAVGDIVRVGGKGTGLFKIAQNASQTIHYGNVDTTTGTGGSLTATNRYDTIELICITANTDFLVLSSVGSFTVV